MTRATGTAIRVIGVCVGAVVAFVAFQGAMRTFETWLSLGILRALGSDSVHALGPATALIVPGDRAAFHVLITPSCSSLASIVAFGCLTPLLSTVDLGRRVAALATASTMVLGGNVVRIAGSMAVGIVAGRSSLVLFHDWVGSIFTFVYTLGGYVFMLMLLLRRSRTRAASLPPRRLALVP